MGDWKEYRLGDILSIKSGFSYQGKYIGSGDSLLLGMGCVSFKEKFLMSGARPYSGSYDDRYKVYPGDIVLATRQQSDNLPILAMPAMIPYALKDKDLVIGTNLYKVEINDKSFSNEYIYWLLKTKRYVKYIAGVKTGTTVSMVTKKNVEDFTFLAPVDPGERDQLVSVISHLDDKIDVNRRICEILEAQAKALFKYWFIDFEPFKNGKFVESELGMIPEGWKICKLGDVCEIVLGGTPSRDRKDFWNGDIAWINSGKVNNFRIVKPSEYITQLGFDNSATKLLPRKTTVIAITGATLGQISLLEIDSCANQSVVGIIENKLIGYEFIYPLIHTKIKELLQLQTGGAQQHINKGNVQDIRFIQPDRETMKNYSSVVRDMYELIGQKSCEIAVLTELRDTLLPKLMSGQITL
jgi:type I restriction enzyme S subunit